MHYSVHYALHAPTIGRGQTRSLLLPCGLERPPDGFGHAAVGKVGSFQPSPRFCPRPNSSSQRAQPECSSTLWFTVWVNQTVNRGVICVFHAPVTRLEDLHS